MLEHTKKTQKNQNICWFLIHQSLFSEGVVSYSIPQGMVRGSTLELMDHTYDGVEDSRTGDLRGGLGQLVDGRYGYDNFKANGGKKGHLKGYDWLGMIHS